MKWLSLILTIISIFPTLHPQVVLAEEETKNSFIQSHLNSNKQLGNKVGKFNLIYKPTVKYQEIKQLLEQQNFDAAVRQLNNSGLVMRSDIPIIFDECGQVNAFWSNQNKTITMCYEYVAFNIEMFQKLGKLSIQEAQKKAINNTIFTFFHELGHALIDVLPLPAVGQEEDTVDEFATIMLLKSNNNQADEIVLDAADFYLLFSNVNKPAVWDEHSLNTKRLFNLVCFVFGSNPEHNEKVFLQTLEIIHDKNEQITQEQLNRRASLCVQDYQQKVTNWNRLLLPHYASKQGGWGNSTTPSSSPSNSQKKPASGGYSRPGKVW